VDRERKYYKYYPLPTIHSEAVMKIQSYKDLIVWQKSVDLVAEIYQLTKLFPRSELYGLASQMQRAAVAIPSNIAEGFRRKGRKEYIQFICIAIGSAGELETQLIIAQKIYSEPNYGKADLLLQEVIKMLFSLKSKLSSLV